MKKEKDKKKYGGHIRPPYFDFRHCEERSDEASNLFCSEDSNTR